MLAKLSNKYKKSWIKHALYCIIPRICALCLLETQANKKAITSIIYTEIINQTEFHDCYTPTHTHISLSLAYFTCQGIPCIYRQKHPSPRQLRQCTQAWTVCYPALLGVSREPAMTALIVDCDLSFCHSHECTGPKKHVKNLSGSQTVLLLFSPPASKCNQSASVVHSGFHLCPERGVTTPHERVGSLRGISGTCR